MECDRVKRAAERPSEVEVGTGVAEQVELMRQLVSGQVPCPIFAKRWLAARDRGITGGERVHAQFDRVLTDLFYVLDDYVIDPSLRQDGDMTDVELIERVRDTLAKLDAL